MTRLVFSGVAFVVLGLSPVLAGPPSGGRSHGGNSWGGGSSSSAGAYYYAPAVPVAPATATAAPAVNGGYYYAPDAAPEAGNSGVLAVKVPANAEVWLNDYKTKLTGQDREYITPPLSGDANYRYHVRVQWTENGQPIVQERDVPVAPGARTSVRFGG